MEKIDCSDYENCPKNTREHGKIVTLHPSFIFLGCWGTYCTEYNNPQKMVSYNKKGILIRDDDPTIVGSKNVTELLSKITNTIDVIAVILAGDNVYKYNYNEEEEINTNNREKYGNELIKNTPYLKTTLYKMEEQLQKGFVECFKEVKTNTYLIGVGNHDIDNCNVLNTQINFKNPKWIMPALSYYRIYKHGNITMKFIFIDTNIYDETYCYKEDGTQTNYSNNARENQMRWIREVLRIKSDHCFVVGHIPFISLSHKKNNKVFKIDTSFMDDIRILYAENKFIYMCADSHNQQFLQPKEINNRRKRTLPVCIISGSGGAELDIFNIDKKIKIELNEEQQLLDEQSQKDLKKREIRNIEEKMEEEKSNVDIFYKKTTFGFVLLTIKNKNTVNVEFHSTGYWYNPESQEWETTEENKQMFVINK